MNNKLRLLQILTIFKEYSDLDHHLTLEQIRARLIAKMDADEKKITNRTLIDDINTLNAFGFVIEDIPESGKATRYYLGERDFELSQLRILIDAMHASRSISIDTKRKIIGKLKDQASQFQRTALHNEMYFDYLVAQNDYVALFVESIHDAIQNQFPITFQYGDYNLQKEFELRYEGKTYEVHPLALVWSNEMYYLITQDALEENKVKHYRIDRMRSVNVDRERTFERPPFDVNDYMSRVFNMFSGPREFVKIRFHINLLNAVFDRFGCDVDVSPDGSEHFILRIEVARSIGFISWLMSFGKNAQALAPASLVEEIRSELDALRTLYQ
ncbi:MAG: helix-turn-helix transcriptional regulator [Bacilli bacterium]